MNCSLFGAREFSTPHGKCLVGRVVPFCKAGGGGVEAQLEKVSSQKADYSQAQCSPCKLEVCEQTLHAIHDSASLESLCVSPVCTPHSEAHFGTAQTPRETQSLALK